MRIFSLLVIAFSISACVNLKAIQDFGEGTSTFSSSYNDVYRGGFETCVKSEELNSTIKEISSLEKVDTLKQIEAAKEFCGPYQNTDEMYGKTSLALEDFGNALSILASQSKFKSKGSTTFLPDFTQINEDMNGVPPILRRYSEEIKQVNRLSILIPELYVNGDIAKLVRDTEVEIKATLVLLDIFSIIYTSQLVNYKTSVDELNQIPVSKNVRPIKQILVRENVNRYDIRKGVLDNYKTSLNDLNESYNKVLERSKLIKPHYGDPIFQGDMNYFLFQINTMIQKSKELSG